MITRIFRVQIKPALRESFERDFQNISMPLVNSHRGLEWLNIGKPVPGTPDEYVMITRWQSAADLDAFVGKNWNQPLIPPGMEQYVVQSWVHHFEDFGAQTG